LASVREKGGNRGKMLRKMRKKGRFNLWAEGVQRGERTNGEKAGMVIEVKKETGSPVLRKLLSFVGMETSLAMEKPRRG